MLEEQHESLQVECACGWETSGPEEVVMESTLEHGRRVHNMNATREQVLEMAVDPRGRPPRAAER